MESFTNVFLFTLSSTSLPTSVFLAIWSASCSLAVTSAKPYLFASFLATVTLLYLAPPRTRIEAGLLGLFALILNLSRRAMSSRISSRDP